MSAKYRLYRCNILVGLVQIVGYHTKSKSSKLVIIKPPCLMEIGSV